MTQITTNDPPMPEVPRKGKPKSHTYNRKCQHVRRLGGSFGWYCQRPTKRGKLLCAEHSGKEVK